MILEGYNMNQLTEFIERVIKGKSHEEIKNGFILKTDGLCQILPNDKTIELEDMQSAVGGHIELVSYVVDDNFEIVVNEEGLVLELPYNLTTFWITGFHFYGDVLVLRKGVLK